MRADLFFFVELQLHRPAGALAVGRLARWPLVVGLMAAAAAGAPVPRGPLVLPVPLGANAVGTDKELEDSDLMNQLLSLDYDILTGGCVLHWVTALERIVNILQDKMGPDFEREKHIDMLLWCLSG